MFDDTRPGRAPGSGCSIESMDEELLPLFDDGDGFQNSPMVLGTIMAVPSNGSGFLANIMSPCYRLVAPTLPKFRDMGLLQYPNPTTHYPKRRTSSREDSSVLSPFMGAERAGADEPSAVSPRLGR